MVCSFAIWWWVGVIVRADKSALRSSQPAIGPYAAVRHKFDPLDPRILVRHPGDLGR